METKILLVDDETRILQTFARSLRLEGYTVVTAENGGEGLARYHQEQPDIVLLDLRMPDIDGLEVLQRIRTHDPEANVILTTGHGDKDAVVEALRAGASDFLSKPIDHLALESALRRAEERIQLKRKLRASQEALRRQNMQLEATVQKRTEELRETVAQLRERVKEATCLFAVHHDMQYDVSVDQLCQRIVEHLIPAMKFPEITVPLIELDGRRFLPPGRTENLSHALSAKIKVEGETIGRLWVTYVEERPFLPEEQDLVNGVAEALSSWLERRQAETALHESEERYRNIVELAPEGILTVNLRGIATSCNSAFLELTGYSRDEIVGTHISQFPTLREEDIKKYTRMVFSALRGNPVEPLEFMWVHKDGTTRWGEARVGPMKQGSKTIGLQLILRDITSRKRTEQLLQALNRASLATKDAFTPEEVFTAVTDELQAMGLSCALYVTDGDQTRLFPKYLTYDSAAIRLAERVVGISREGFSIPVDRADAYREVVREKRTVFVENTGELVRQLLPRPIKRFAPQIVEIIGIQKAIDAPLIVGNQVIGILAVQSDALTAEDIPTITAFAHQVAAAWHKAQLLEEAQRLTTKLKAIARPARQMSALLDQDELAWQVVESLQEITGCYNANLFLRQGDDLVFAAGQGGYEDGGPPLGYRLPPGQGIIGHVARSGQPALVPDVEEDPRYQAWEGLPHTRSELAVPLKRGDRVLGVMDMQSAELDAFDAIDLEALTVLADQLAVAVDNARLFEETQRLQRFNQDIVHSMAEGIVLEDTEGQITFVNPKTAELLGYTPEELVGQNWRAIVPAEHRDQVAQETAQRPQGVASRYETALLTKDGREIPAIVSAQPLFENGHFTGVLSVFADITERKHLERALEERQLYLEAVLGAAPDAIVTMEGSHRILEWNQGAERLFGYTRDEVTGQDLDRLVAGADPDMLDQATAFTQQAFAGQPVPPTETVRYRKDGTPVSVILGCAPIQIEGELMGVVVVYTDITQRKQMEKALQERTAQLEALREITLGMSAQLELDELLHHIVERGCQLLDVAGGSLYLVDEETERLEQVISYGYRKDHSGSYIAPGEGIAGRVLERGEPLIVDDYRRLEEQSEEWVDEDLTACLGVPLRRGERVIGTLGFDEIAGPRRFDPQDVWLASLFANQAAIAIANARLYEEVRRQADELRDALDQTRELDRLKSEFIQNVSHELRSPLALIRGYAEMLDMGELGGLDPVQEEPVAIIARRARMLSALVEDITLILGAEVNPPNPEPVALGELAHAAVADFQISATAAELTLETEIASDLSPVRGTSNHLRRVLDNLMGNAIKFTPPEGMVTVRVVQPEEDHIVLEVSDTGIGIRPDQQDRIFERFYQVDGSTKRRYAGTGLGLALVKEIVETYGGEIHVESEVGAGSTFVITLPVFQRDEAGSTSPRSD